MTENYKPTYLVSNLDRDQRLNELEPHIERNIEEIKEDKTGSRTLEAKYREFLYFMARYEASPIDRQAVELLKGEIKDFDRKEMDNDMQSRRDAVAAEEALELKGAMIAERYKKYIEYRDIKTPNNLTLAGNLDMNLGIPLRAKYFGTGVSSTHIKTWDQLLYALETVEPRIVELDENDKPTEITGKKGVTTAPFWDSRGLRTDKADGLKKIMGEFTPTK